MDESAAGQPVIDSITGAVEPATAVWSSPRSRADRPKEEVALGLVRGGKLDEAIAVLVKLYGQPLISFAQRVIRDRELARDICQTVFLEAFRGIAKYEGRSSLWSWLCGITSHRCIDELRRRKRAANDTLEVVDHVADVPDTDEQFAGRRALEQCLSKLNEPLRAQVLMRFYGGLSFVEIGEYINDTAGTVQVRINRALPLLQRCLRNQGVRR